MFQQHTEEMAALSEKKAKAEHGKNASQAGFGWFSRSFDNAGGHMAMRLKSVEQEIAATQAAITAEARKAIVSLLPPEAQVHVERAEAVKTAIASKQENIATVEQFLEQFSSNLANLNELVQQQVQPYLRSLRREREIVQDFKISIKMKGLWKALESLEASAIPSQEGVQNTNSNFSTEAIMAMTAVRFKLWAVSKVLPISLTAKLGIGWLTNEADKYASGIQKQKQENAYKELKDMETIVKAGLEKAKQTLTELKKERDTLDQTISEVSASVLIAADKAAGPEDREALDQIVRHAPDDLIYRTYVGHKFYQQDQPVLKAI